MKRKIYILLFAVFLALTATIPAFAAADWDSFVLEMEKRSRIKETGAVMVKDLLKNAPAGTESELWSMLWSGDHNSRAAAAVALVDRVFPDGDPSRWQEVSGFVSDMSLRPRQLLAMDAFFAAIDSLSALPDGACGAAYLLELFGRSAFGKVTFIEEIPQGMDVILKGVVSATGLPGDWSIKRVRGRLPLLPVYGGSVTSSRADSENMQYLDGYGSIASNGVYAWDRNRGRVYRVIEGGKHRGIWIRN